MLYVKPHFYDQFQCIADRCPDTCCAGWQIMIDQESLLKYSRVEGGFGNRLMTSIDWEEGAFLQFDGRCSCLNGKSVDLSTSLARSIFAVPAGCIRDMWRSMRMSESGHCPFPVPRRRG